MNIWMQAAIAVFVGLIPGLTLFIWLASPFGPPTWVLTEPFTRIFMTVSQFLRGKGVLVKCRDDKYRLGMYTETDRGDPVALVEGREIPLDEDSLVWGLFGKKPFGVTWEAGTSLHQRIRADADGEAMTDGGEGLAVNIAAAHRYFEGCNDADAISRTEEHAKAEYGGGETALSDKQMAGLIALMMLLGSVTSWFMVAG